MVKKKPAFNLLVADDGYLALLYQASSSKMLIPVPLHEGKIFYSRCSSHRKTVHIGGKRLTKLVHENHMGVYESLG